MGCLWLITFLYLIIFTSNPLVQPLRSCIDDVAITPIRIRRMLKSDGGGSGIVICVIGVIGNDLLKLPTVSSLSDVTCFGFHSLRSYQLSTGIIGIPALGRRPGNLDVT